MPDAIHVIDRDMRIVLFNRVFQRWCRDLGIPHLAGAIGRRFDEVFPFLPSSVGEEYRQVFSTGRPLETEETTQVQERRVVTHTTKIPVSENGTVERIVTVIRDITSLKDAEDAIRENERKLENLMSNLPGMMVYRCTPDPERTMEFVSEGCRELTGYAPGELVDSGHNRYGDLIHPEDRISIGNSIREALGTHESFSFEYRIRTRDGRERWVWELGRGIFADTGEIEALEGLISDISDRKAAAEALWESEEKYRELVEHANSVILKLDTGGKITFYNEYAEALFGYSKNEAVGASPVDLFLPATDSDGRDLRSLFTEVCRNPDAYPMNETETKTRDGRTVWIRWINRAIYDTAGVLSGVLTVGVDITERKIAEKALSDMNARLYTLLNALPDVVYFKDAAGRHLLVNRAFENLVSMPLSKITGKTNRDLLPASLAAQCDWSDAKVLGGRRSVTTREELSDPAGHMTYFETIKVPIFNNAGDVENIVGVSRNITGRIEAEASIRESEERYRAVVEDQTELISRFRPDGTQVFVNDAYCRYVGKTRDEIIGTRFKPCIPTEDRVRLDALLSSLTPASSTGTIEHRIIMPDKTVRWQQWIDRGFFDEQGTLREIQSVGRDITATKDAEEAHRRSEDLYRTVFETTGSATMILNDDGTIWRANSEFSSLFGFFSEDLEGKSALDLFEEEERGRLRLYHRDRRGSGPFPPRSYETWIIDRQGMRRDVMLTVDMIPETQQSVVSILDLTAQKQAERLINVANAINKLIVHERNVTDLLISACEEFGRLNRYFVVSISLRDGEILRPVAISDERFTGTHFSDVEGKLFSEVVKSGNAMFETYSEEDGMDPFNALLIVPMTVESDVKGILAIYLYPMAHMRDQEIESMKTLADDLAYAIKSIGIETEKRLVLEQIEKNIEQMAVLNDHIRNPLQAIVGLADLQGGEMAEKIFGQAQEIDRIIHRLDIGWVESTKIREFLVKHYGMGK
ncbi:MAG: PAS domain S-box protein [Methanomicrobiaceae archaeon]|nr:PAS domain S-box protein [Methanomicrobiaceae archaeon]